MTPNQVRLGELVVAHYGSPLKEGDRNASGPYAVYGSSGVVGRHDQALVTFPTIVIGRKGSVGSVVHAPEGGWPIDTTFYLQVRRPDTLDLRYLYWALSRASLDRRAITTSIPGLNRDELYRTRILLPPLIEQRRIAAVLDKADAIRRKRRESLRLLDEFLRSAFLEMFGDPVTNEKGWEVRSLGEVAAFVGGGTPSRKVKSFFAGPICWATAKDIQGEFLADTQEHITQDAIDNSATKLVEEGTILIVVKSKVLMHRLPVTITRVPVCFGQDLKGIVLHDRLPQTYVARHLRVGEKWLLNKARGANTEGLTLEHLKAFPLMVPPREQTEQYDRLEVKHHVTRDSSIEHYRHANALFDSLAQGVFHGEL